MTTATALDAMLVRSVIAYSDRVRDAVLAQHPGASVCSPLGVWVLLCACLTAADEADCVELEAVVGCSQAEASELLDAFVENVPRAIRAALAVWARDEVSTDRLTAWMAGLPAGIDRGPVPTQEGVNTWAESNTFGLIREFPMSVERFDLVLASALATRVSWRDPYEVAVAAETFAPSSPWSRAVQRVLWTDRGWRSAIVDTATAGTVAVHQAIAEEELVVICVSADPAVPRDKVLAAAHEISQCVNADNELPAHSLFDIPLGQGHSWMIEEHERQAQQAGQRFETITSIALPAWQIESELQLLASPAFGATTATRILHNMIGDGPDDSRQVAFAQFDRYGFKAAAVTGIGVACALAINDEIGVERIAELRFDHPFAVIAVCREPWGDPTRFRGLPVFEAWIDTPIEVPAGGARPALGYGASMRERNWAGNYEYGARTVHQPESVEALQELIAAAPAIRVLGSRHSFTDIADSEELVNLAGLPAEVTVDRAAGTVVVPGGIRYGDLVRALEAEQMALANLASLPHISVAGAVATATHGSGERIGNLASAVTALELVTADGELRAARRGDPDFGGLVVGLGATGAVTRVTLEIEPAYEVRQRVFEGLAWDALLEHFDAIAASGDSVSVFTRWGEQVDQVWVKTRVSGEPEPTREQLFGATAASVERHPIIGLDPVNCTPQLGVPGPWSERLPHFRMGFTPSSGDEIQSEYLLARPHATAAIDALRLLAPQIAPLIQVSEVRMIAGDDLWMSTAYGQDTVAIHFTWIADQAAVERTLIEIEAALAPFGARPHWGKLFGYRADTLAPLYRQHGAFVALIERLDPRGAFRNRWLQRHVLGES